MPRPFSVSFLRQPLTKLGLAGLLSLWLAGLCLQFGGPVPIAQAATFNIPDGDIAALKAALTAPGAPHIINLAPGGTYTLTTVDNGGYLQPTGLPVIDRNITINGNGATITRSKVANTPIFRLFYISYTGNLTLNNLTLSNGQTAYYDANGGAIFNFGGSATIYNCTFVDNKAFYSGDAIFSLAQSNGNSNEAVVNTTVVNSVFSTSFTGPSTGASTAIFNFAQGIYNGTANVSANLIVTNSVFFNNSSNTASMGIGSEAAGLSPTYTATTNLTITGSTFDNNLASNSSRYGGGVTNIAFSDTGNATAIANIINSTLTNNKADNGGAIANLADYKAGVATATLNILNSTIANNNSPANTGAIYSFSVSEGGGGSANLTTTLKNTIVSNNTGGNCGGILPFAAGLNNLEYPGTIGSPTCGANSTVLTTNPLSPSGLADNGGPTKTIALPSSSPAINAGDAATCADPATVNNKDQRGVTRPQGPGCDIGAYEYGSPALTVSPDSLTFTAALGGTNPPAQSIAIGNPADASGSLDWNIGAVNYLSGSGWLACTPTSGTSLAAGASANVSCQTTTGALALGTYSATFQVTSSTPGVVGSPRTVQVQFVIKPPPTLTVTPQNLTFNASAAGANPPPQTIAIGNQAGTAGPLDWSLSAINYLSGAGWLACTPVSGNTLAPGTSANVSCQATTGQLAAGSYSATFQVTSSTPGVVGSPITVSVSFVVGNPIWLVTSPDDSGVATQIGTLSYALKYTTAGQTITFQLTGGGRTVKVTGGLPPLLDQVNIADSCVGGPHIIIDGTGVTADGLTLNGNNHLTGLLIKGFMGRQIVTVGKGNLLSCVATSRL